MPKATQPRTDDAAIEIGKIIEQHANGNISKSDAEASILALVDRPDGNPPIGQIRIEMEADNTEKIVVVPDPAILTDMKPVTTAGNYDFREIYRNQAAKALLDEFDSLGGSGGLSLRAFMEEKRDKAVDLHDFFYFRLGEYSVTQCK